MAELSECVQMYEQRLAESTEALSDAERRALEAELGSRASCRDASASRGRPLRESDEESGAGRLRYELESERAELERACQMSKRNIVTIQEEVSWLREELHEHEQCVMAEREAVFQQTELRCYRAVEEE